MSFGFGLSMPHWASISGRAVWTPAALGAALALWLDGADSSTITLNGSTVSQWNDKSGNGRHASQGTAANQPTYNATGANGRPIIDFDGVDDSLTLAANFGASRTNFNVFTAARGGPSTAGNKSIVLGTADGFLFNLRAGSQVRSTSGIGYAVTSIGAADVFGNYGFVATTTTTLDVRTFDSGNLVSSQSFAGTGYNTNYITHVARGDGGAGTTTSSTKISEIVVTLTAISTTDRQLLEGYLAWKWGLQGNLPSDHPYRWNGSIFGFPFVPWTPSTLGSALSLWLDANDATTITLNGSTVSQWRDKSANTRNVAQATAANQPTYQATGLNGRPALNFDGADWLFNATPGALLRNVAGGSLTAVASYAIIPAAAGVPIGVINPTPNARFNLNIQTTGFLATGARRLDTDTAASSATSAAQPVNTPVIHGAVANYTGNSLQIFSNGTAATAATFPSGGGNSSDTDANTLVVGASSSDDGVTVSNPFTGQLSEIVLTSGVLSTTDRQLLEGYLAWKWSGLI